MGVRFSRACLSKSDGRPRSKSVSSAERDRCHPQLASQPAKILRVCRLVVYQPVSQEATAQPLEV